MTKPIKLKKGDRYMWVGPLPRGTGMPAIQTVSCKDEMDSVNENRSDYRKLPALLERKTV